MTEKKGNDIVSYILGINSIVFAFFQPLAGFILGIIGYVQSRRENTDFAKKGRTLSIIGMVLSAVLFILLLIFAVYFQDSLLGLT